MKTFFFIEKHSIVLQKWMSIIALTLKPFLCPAQSAKNIQFNHFSADHRLSQAYFNPILQDKKGYMWFGTSNGLIKYDGYSFTTFQFDPTIKNSLPYNVVDRISEDNEGNIWTAAENDFSLLCKYNPHTGNFTPLHQNIKNKISGTPGRVNCLITDKQGKLWIGTDAGLYYYETVSGKFINLFEIIHPDTLCSLSINCLMIDHNSLLWIGTSNGINIYDPFRKKLNLFKPADRNYAAMNKEVICMLEDHSGNLWISLWNNGIYHYNSSSGIAEIYRHSESDSNSLCTNAVNKLIEDSHQKIWAAMWGGISIYQPETNNFKTYRNDANDNHSLVTDQITNIFEDKSGALWIGTNGGGLNNCYPSNKNFTVYQNYDKAFISHFPLSLYKDREGRIFMTTFGAGVQEFNPATGNLNHIKLFCPIMK